MVSTIKGHCLASAEAHMNAFFHTVQRINSLITTVEAHIKKVMMLCL